MRNHRVSLVLTHFVFGKKEAMSRIENSLRLTEIFFSLQGESTRIGVPTVFVRLTGCPLRCTWCDSAYAFQGGQTWEIDAILAEVAQYPTRTVCVTGGEPLAQRGCLALLTALCDAGYSVSIETSGALPIEAVDARVSRIMDVKAPGSGEMDKNLPENLAYLTPKDELKFVLADEADYLWAKSWLTAHDVYARVGAVLFSPVWATLTPTQLADWIVRDGLSVRMQVQLHKILWGEKPGV